MSRACRRRGRTVPAGIRLLLRPGFDFLLNAVFTGLSYAIGYEIGRSMRDLSVAERPPAGRTVRRAVSACALLALYRVAFPTVAETVAEKLPTAAAWFAIALTACVAQAVLPRQNPEARLVGRLQAARIVIELGLPAAVAVGASIAMESIDFSYGNSFFVMGYVALIGLPAGLMVGTLALLDDSSAHDTPWRLQPAARAGLAGLVVFAVVSAVVVTVSATDHIPASEDVRTALIAGMIGGVLVALLQIISSYVATPASDLDRTEPRVALRRDRRAALAIIGLAVGVNLFWNGLHVLALGATLLCILLLASGSRWPAYVCARTLLYLDRSLPWRVMDFLADAHDRGVLRRVGSAYQFRHVRIKESLAGRAT